MSRLRSLALTTALITAPALAHAAEDRWWLTCSDDPIEDRRICHVENGNLWVSGAATLTGVRVERVSVGERIAPGSEMIFRVDRHTPVRLPANEQPILEKIALLVHMKLGQRALVRWTPAGETVPVTVQISLTGFAPLYDEMQARLDAYGKPAGQ